MAHAVTSRPMIDADLIELQKNALHSISVFYPIHIYYDRSGNGHVTTSRSDFLWNIVAARASQIRIRKEINIEQD